MEMKFDYSKNYNDQLKEAQEFQDYWCDYLWKNECIAIANFSSQKYQYEVGENLQGFEFKYDKLFKDTNNLWIEIEERTKPEYSYKPSGILREDNAWIYCIGNYDTLYLFTVKGLRKLYKNQYSEIRENTIRTSRGFLLPKDDAEKYCAKKINTTDNAG